MDLLTFVISAVVIGLMVTAVTSYFIQRSKGNKKDGCIGCPMADKCSRKHK